MHPLTKRPEEFLTRVPQLNMDDHRRAGVVLDQPVFRVYDFNALDFPNTQGPVIRGNGDYTSIGFGVMVDHQAKWDRGDTSLAGPVRTFFRNMLAGQNRIKGV